LTHLTYFPRDGALDIHWPTTQDQHKINAWTPTWSSQLTLQITMPSGERHWICWPKDGTRNSRIT